jgi:hypothetical protein
MDIQQTSNYNLFTTITGNRIINKKKVEKLVDDINNGLNLLPYCPIIVYEDDNELKIVDGQHRFETSQKLNLPVYYVVCDKLDLRQIARLNSRSDKWSNKDFLECYISLGIEDYKLLQEFIKEYEMIYSAAIELLMNGKVKTGKNTMEIFRDGELKVNHLEVAKEMASLAREVFFRYKFRNDRYIIQAVQELKEKGLCDFEVLTQKIAATPMLMNPQGSAKEYIYNIERVYNHNNQKRVVIF